MAGVRHDPIADIGLISDNLRDRYKTGFPILKEIVQNADDAGASHLSFGYSSGLLNSEHELLKGPAVFFINDGPLRSSDADAILSIALGSKASNENTIGKFGLGMKSLFHLCEAFFYMSDQWDSNEEFHSNIFNPWGHLRQKWELFSHSDKILIQEHLQGVLNAFKECTNNKTWFIVWVPLRKRQLNGDGSIKEYYPGDDVVLPDFISDKTIAVNLGQLLPLLKGLNGISTWGPSTENRVELHCISTIKLNDVAVRRQFHASIVNSKLAGKVKLEKDNEQNLIEYAGHEELLVDERFDEIRSSEFWPKSYERDSITGKEQQVKDKAKPHLAVVICQRKVEGRASCHIDWSVFLPLGTYPQIERTYWVNDDDKYDTQVFIHGFFFIDAGRKFIYELDAIGQDLKKLENNEQVSSQWNSILATEGCLSYLPLAVKNFVEAHKCGFERTQHLSEAIYKSDFVKKYQQWIGFRYQWIFQLEKDKRSWELISADLIVLPLPNQTKADKSRAWSVFPKLIELSADRYVFYDQSQVALLNKNHEGWDDNLLSKALEIDVLTVFSDRILFTYLNDFLSLAGVKQTEVIKQQLFLLARDAMRISNETWIKSELTSFLRFIPPGRCVVLNKVKLNGLWAELAEVQTRVLVISVEIAPEYEQKTSLTVDDAKLLLEALDKVLSNENRVKYHEEAQALVSEIIGLVEAINKERLLRDCSNFKLFKVHELSEKKDKFFAKSELISIQNNRELFRFSSGLGADRFGYGDFLLKAT